MTLRNRQCSVQVQASRVSARIAALTVLALAPALAWHPVTPGDDVGPSAHGMRGRQPRGERHTKLQKGTLGGSNRLLSSRDVAAILAVPERTVRDRWKEWGLPAYRIGKHLRWKERDVYAWIERQSA
jgi:excisionase family DNA binding protein